jgi:hypothetical protein
VKLWFKRVSVALLGATGLAVAALSVFVWRQVRAFDATVSRVHIPLVARSTDPDAPARGKQLAESVGRPGYFLEPRPILLQGPPPLDTR